MTQTDAATPKTEHVTHGVDIDLVDVTKRYAGQQEAAVDDISMHIPAGKIVVLVGPSGCGKTTTMKMINRLIEPTEGKILLDGDNVIERDLDELRRHIGYVIQAGGLFPHMTVAQNVAMVPQLLGWDKQRTTARVDEMLDLVGLEPGSFRSRYPRQLSGGQQQRVGVARALAADPPVLLMDEPFGAVDPITRARLQDELIRLQEELRKTIVFVTHDFDEAVKLGDRIAVLAQGSHVVPYDTPAEILTNPATDYVSEFVGAGAALKQLTVTRVRDVEIDEAVTVTIGGDAADAARRARQAGRSHAVLLDDRGRPLRWLSLRDLENDAVTRDTRRDENLEAVSTASTLNNALDQMLTSSHGVVLVCGRDNAYVGAIRVDTIMTAMQELQSGTAEPAGERAP
jgi:osmoprotectant transport system ATP-binding protein